jgi:hypothetical protein
MRSQRILVGRLAGRLELEVEVLQEVDAGDRGQLHLGSLAEYRLLIAR